MPTPESSELDAWAYLVVRDPPNAILHVFPLHDTLTHLQTEYCPCEPEITPITYEDMLVGEGIGHRNAYMREKSSPP